MVGTDTRATGLVSHQPCCRAVVNTQLSVARAFLCCAALFGNAEKARWLEESGRCDLTAEERDAFQASKESFNAFRCRYTGDNQWPNWFIRHHLQDFFHPEFNVSGDVEEWKLDENADVWKITCDFRERYAFFFALFSAVAQESGTILRFYSDGLMYELTSGSQMP